MIGSRSPHTISVGARRRGRGGRSASPAGRAGRSIVRRCAGTPREPRGRRARRSRGPARRCRRRLEPERAPSSAADGRGPRRASRRDVSSGSTSSAPRQRGRAQQQVDLAAEAAAGDEHEALAALGELVGKLHRDPAAERVPDERRALVAERDQQVADAAGVARRASSRRAALPTPVPEQVRRDHREAAARCGSRAPMWPTWT